MLVNIDDDVLVAISCVAFFYEKGKSRNSFPRKEKFRAQLPCKEKTLKSLTETGRYINAPMVILESKTVSVSVSVKQNCTQFYAISRYSLPRLKSVNEQTSELRLTVTCHMWSYG